MTRHPLRVLEDKVRTTLLRHAMCASGDHLLVALSGGIDSMALLHLLHRLAPGLGLTLSVAHLHHGIRGKAADLDQRFSRQSAENLGLAFYTTEADVPALARKSGCGLEEAARTARHAFLRETASDCGARRIALGHHKGDVAEQLLLNLLRGSGLKGLGAMEPVTESGIIRPLIDLSRDELDGWLDAHGIGHVTDASNSDTAYTRNRVRHRLIPLLEEAFNPSAVDTLARTAALLREEETWLQEMTDTLYADCLTAPEAGGLALSTGKLRALHPAARRRVLRRAAGELCGSTQTLTQAHIQSLAALLDHGGSGRSVDLSRGLRGVLTRDVLHLLVESESLRTKRPDLLSEAPPFSYAVERPEPETPTCLAIGETGDCLVFRWATAPATDRGSRGAFRLFLDPERLTFPLTVRNARPGDRFRPEGGSGSRKLGRFLSDCGIAGPRRSEVPLVVADEEILWVAGWRSSEAPPPPPAGGPALEVVFKPHKKG